MNNLFPTEALSVSELNALVKRLLENQLKNLWVSGEVSNLTQASSGHYYFLLKDASAQVRCVLFKTYAARLSEPLKEGAHIELTGNISLYEARGEFQITVTEVQQTGLGKLFAAFTQLKNKLQKEGLFDQTYKQALPDQIQTIGIVTSPAAAALRDVISTLKRRMSNLKIILYPTNVQGAGSELQIAKAINQANDRAEVDVLIVCRGGGSIEDLWAFNEEIVARAIFNCSIPIVAGIGHETDFTIADFVADLRAPTPTAAAEMTSPDKNQLLMQLKSHQQNLKQTLERRYFSAAQKLDWLSKNLRHPKQKLLKQQQTIASYQQSLQHFILIGLKQRNALLNTKIQQVLNKKPNLKNKYSDLSYLEETLQQTLKQNLQLKQQNILQQQKLLIAVAPQNILARGFSIVKNSKNQVINSAQKLKQGEAIEVIFSQGTIRASVYSTDDSQEELPFS